MVLHDVDYRIKLGEYKWGKQHIEGTGSIRKASSAGTDEA